MKRLIVLILICLMLATATVATADGDVPAIPPPISESDMEATYLPVIVGGNDYAQRR